MICAFRDGPPQLLDRQVDGQGRWAFLCTESHRPKKTHLHFNKGLEGYEKVF